VKTKEPTRPAAAARPPVAYSYLRFSTPKQAEGDSLRRQTEDTTKWCARQGIPLDTTATLADLGRSAFKKGRRAAKVDDGMAGLPELDELVNPDRRALAGFLELIRRRQVPRGSYLVIENLDRLSRDDVVPATHLLLSVLVSGVKVTQLQPRELVLTDKSEMGDVMLAVIELSRGNSESKMKSVRTLAKWEAAIRLAREQGRLVTRLLPAWVELTDAGLALIPERAKAVRRIFELAPAGYGMTSIVKKLNAEKVPAFGARELDGEGRHRKVSGKPFGCGEWRTCYVRRIISDRRALGEYQPRDAHERKRGDPIPGYYPAVVTEAEFKAARAAVLGRKRKPGRIGTGVANLFGGLLRDARDGGSYYVAPRDAKAAGGGLVRTRILLNSTSIEGKAECFTFPYAVFERAVLTALREIDPAEVLGRPAAPADAAALRRELDRVKAELAEVSMWMDAHGFNPTVGKRAADLEARKEQLAAALDDADERAAKPPEESWAEVKDLAQLLDQTPPEEIEDVRLRLRAVIRRVVKEIWLLVVPRGRMLRVCNVQLWFDGDHHRDVGIIYRSPLRNQYKSEPGRWWFWTHADRLSAQVESLVPTAPEYMGTMTGFGDYRRPGDPAMPHGVKDDLESWENIPPWVLDRLLVGGHDLQETGQGCGPTADADTDGRAQTEIVSTDAAETLTTILYSEAANRMPGYDKDNPGATPAARDRAAQELRRKVLEEVASGQYRKEQLAARPRDAEGDALINHCMDLIEPVARKRLGLP
jgi:DNA invertase Pin-like site-specific DNA recombinase